MKPHTKNYMAAHGYGMDDLILCEQCLEKGLSVRAVDIHHKVHRSQGGGDEASNLIALCRQCHDEIHCK